jgi:antitoxin CptB
MTDQDRTLDRIRWRCRRGMLELDLVLNAFLARHFETLDAGQLDALRELLECPDPQLLDFVMGHDEPDAPAERDIVALMRAVSTGTASAGATTTA